MKLYKAKNKVPFIQLEKGRLCFVKLTSNSDGYKHIRFTNSTITELSTSAATARRKTKRRAKTVTINEQYNTVMDMKLTRGHTSAKPEGTGPPNKTIPQKTTKKLRELIDGYLNKDGVFPYNKIDLLKKRLDRIEVKNNPKIKEPEIIEEEIEIKNTNTFSDSTSADRKRKKKKRVVKKKSRVKKKRKKRKKK